MAGYVRYRNPLVDLEKRQRKWAVMKSRRELRLYKTHSDYYAQEELCKVISMGDAVLEVNREWDYSDGYYIKMAAGPETVHELWAETQREYELWVDFLKQ